MKKAPPFTRAEDATLTEMWNDAEVGIAAIAEVLGRAKASIVNRANRLRREGAVLIFRGAQASTIGGERIAALRALAKPLPEGVRFVDDPRASRDRGSAMPKQPMPRSGASSLVVT